MGEAVERSLGPVCGCPGLVPALPVATHCSPLGTPHLSAQSSVACKMMACTHSVHPLFPLSQPYKATQLIQELFALLSFALSHFVKGKPFKDGTPESCQGRACPDHYRRLWITDVNQDLPCSVVNCKTRTQNFPSNG